MNIPFPSGNKADHVRVGVRNAEATTTIPRGTPLSLVLNATEDGLAVVLPATATAAKAQSGCYGVALADIPANQLGESMIFGIVPYALLTRMTRAASTDSWSSSASMATGVLLALDTINNAFLTASASLGSNNFLPFAILAQTVASAAASASATSDSRTAITVGVRAFVRML